MPMHHQIKVALIICLLLAIVGCVPTTVKMYEGPALPPEETATIKGSWHYNVVSNTSIIILKADGKFAHITTDPIEVLPGEHEITVRIEHGNLATGWGWMTLPSQTLSFQAEAGRVYRVDGSFFKGHIWVVDETTGVEVAAHRPERPEPIEHKPF